MRRAVLILSPVPSMYRFSPRAALPSVLLVVSTAGCVRVSTTRLSAASFPVVPPDSVRVFATRAPAAYTELAVLRVRRVWRSDPAALAALRASASRVGADGLLLLNTRSGGTGRGGIGGVILGGGASGGILVGNADANVDEFARAVAIRLTPAGADSSRPPGVLHR